MSIEERVEQAERAYRECATEDTWREYRDSYNAAYNPHMYDQRGRSRRGFMGFVRRVLRIAR